MSSTNIKLNLNQHILLVLLLITSTATLKYSEIVENSLETNPNLKKHLVSPIFNNNFMTITPCDDESAETTAQYFDSIDVEFENRPTAGRNCEVAASIMPKRDFDIGSLEVKIQLGWFTLFNKEVLYPINLKEGVIRTQKEVLPFKWAVSGDYYGQFSVFSKKKELMGCFDFTMNIKGRSWLWL